MSPAKKPKGIRRTKEGTWQVFAKRAGQFRSKTFKADTDLIVLKRERDKLIGRILEPPTTTDEPAGTTTFAEDAAAYLQLVTGMPSYDDRVYDIGQWTLAFGPRRRSSITSRDMRAALEQWRVDGRADGTGGLSNASLNRRRTALMALYTTLDGKAAANPVKDVPKYDESASQRIRARDPKLLYRLIARVAKRKWKSRRPANQGTPHKPSKTRARLRLMLWTGWPPKQIMKLTADDIDWKDETAWIGPRRKGQGAKGRRLPLFPGAVVALKAFAAANAWGEFSTSGMHKALQRAVGEENAWRARHKKPPIAPVNPYVLRHAFGTELAKRTTDERVIQEMMLHSTPQQTRRYTEAATSTRLLEARAAIVPRPTKTRKVAGKLRAARRRQEHA